MDQIYLPKNRSGLPAGSYVIITAIKQNLEKQAEKRLIFYGIKKIEPIKIEIINKSISIINKHFPNRENIIITGSFLDKGFNFNDLDIIIVTLERQKKEEAEKEIMEKIGIFAQIEKIKSSELVAGLKTDPFYTLLLSKCVTQKKIIFKTKKKYNYEILDVHLLKSKSLINNFDILVGKEKYKLTRNLMAINMFLKDEKINQDSLNNEMRKEFNLKDIKEIKENVLDKKEFIRKYIEIYNESFNKIMRGIKHDSKQRQNN